MVAKHRAENADITVVSHPVPADKVGAVGILKIDPATGASSVPHPQHCCSCRASLASRTGPCTNTGTREKR